MLSPIQIMVPGSFTASSGERITFTEAMLRDCAAVYDPQTYEAPLVIGHPETGLPAYGWIGGVVFDGGALLAVPRTIAPELEDAVRAGQFQKVSGAFFLPDRANNPAPGHTYLQHVGFLGAASPAVKGLRPLSFADVAEDIRLPRGFLIDAKSAELHRRAVAFRKAHGGDYIAAVRAVCPGDQW